MSVAGRRPAVAIATALAVCAAAAAAAPAGAAKPTPYKLIVYHEPGGNPAGEYNAYLFKPTSTWSVEGRCDGGTYVKARHHLTLQDECAEETIYLVKSRSKVGTWEGFGNYAFFELIREPAPGAEGIHTPPAA